MNVESLQSIENFIALSNMVIQGNVNALLVYGSGDYGKMYALKGLLGHKIEYKEPKEFAFEGWDVNESYEYFGKDALIRFFVEFQTLKNNRLFIKAEQLAKEVSIANGIPRAVLLYNIVHYDYVIIKNIVSVAGLKDILNKHNSKMIIIHESDSLISQVAAQSIITQAIEGEKLNINSKQFKFTGRLIFVTNLENAEFNIKSVNLNMDKETILSESKRILNQYALGLSLRAREKTIDLFKELINDIPITDFTMTNIIKMSLVYDRISNSGNDMARWKCQVKKFLNIS